MNDGSTTNQCSGLRPDQCLPYAIHNAESTDCAKGLVNGWGTAGFPECAEAIGGPRRRVPEG
jgi:hypothetical protein